MSQHFSRLILNWSGRAGYHRSNPSGLALCWQCMAPAAAQNTEVRRHLLKPEFKSRLRPLSFWQVIFLTPTNLWHWGYFLPTLPSTVHCGHGHRETKEKCEGSLERFFLCSYIWAFLRKQAVASPAEQTEPQGSRTLSWAWAANLSLPQQSAIPAAPRGVCLTSLERLPVTETTFPGNLSLHLSALIVC